jgi:glycosyltransferase involved in cell wall biosynthesis
VETLLQHHDVFVLPSRREGFGLALVEAMAAGLPVVASNLQGPAEIITHGENGLLFEPGNIDSLVSQLLMLIEQPEWIPRLSEAGVQRAMMFSIEKMATTLCKLYYQQVGCYLETAENVTKADQQLKTSRQKEHPHEETAHVP